MVKASRSDEVADDFIGTDHGACGKGFFGALGIDLISDEAIFGGVDFIEEEIPESGELGVFKAALEDGILHPDPEVLTNAGNAGKPFL